MKNRSDTHILPVSLCIHVILSNLSGFCNGDIGIITVRNTFKILKPVVLDVY